jgi:catechol 2,3-dioxygenase-like lactoylglutathione lyase family enzyme
MMGFKYHHIHLVCSDLEEMIRFFTEDMGAELVERRKFGESDGATLDQEGVRINLRVGRESDAIVEDSSRVRHGYDHLGLEVEDLEAAYNQLKDKGYTFTVPPQDLGNLKFAFFKGPDNITIEILQPIG